MLDRISASHNNIRTIDDKKAKRTRAVKIAVAAGTVAVGAALLYKNRNSKPILTFKNFVKNSMIAPFKEKDVPFKKKVSNVWQNLKTGVKNLWDARKTPAKQGFVDTVEINNVKEKSVQDKVVSSSANPEIKPETAEVQKDIKKEAEAVSDLKSTPKAEETKPKAKAPLDKKKAAKQPKPSKASKASKPYNNLMQAAKNNARNLRTAAGAAAVVTGGAVAGKEITDAVQENKEKSFSITLNGEEFKGRLEDGMAYDEKGNPLNGTLTVIYDSGKKVLIKYDNGFLRQSVAFSDKSHTIPKTIRSYRNDGKIVEKHDKLRPDVKKGDTDFKSGIVRDYYPDSMLRRVTEFTDRKGNSSRVSYFVRNTDEDGKIIGEPIKKSIIETKKSSNGSTYKSISVPYNGEDRVIRTSSRAKDGSLDIALNNMEGKEIARLSTDSDKKAVLYRHVVDGGELDGIIELEDGKIKDIKYGSVGEPLTLISEYDGTTERFMASDGSVVEICYDFDAVSSISRYSSDDVNLMPEVEIIFKDGKAVCDTFYDEKTGDILFQVNH